MNKGPIILIDDDAEDLDLIKQGFEALNVQNEIIMFERSVEAVEYLFTTKEPPFLILCDINMPGMDGFELRRRSFANPEIRRNSVPFLFLSTSGDRPSIKSAYELSIQGYFVKPIDFEGILEMLRNIISYWQIARKPY